MTAVLLPTTKTKKIQKWTDRKFLTIGHPGVGKSEFWAQGENSFFFDTEGNLSHLETYSVPIRSWSDFRNTVLALYQQKAAGQFPYDTLCIDTLDRWLDYANEEVISRAHEKYAKAIEKGLTINTIADVPEGNGWANRMDLIKAALGSLQELGCAVVLVGHTKQITIKDSVKEYDKLGLNIGGQVGEFLTGWSHHTLNVEGIYSGNELTRIVWTIPSQSREAKSHGGLIPNGWKWGKDSKENYAKMRGLFS